MSRYLKRNSTIEMSDLENLGFPLILARSSTKNLNSRQNACVVIKYLTCSKCVEERKSSTIVLKKVKPSIVDSFEVYIIVFSRPIKKFRFMELDYHTHVLAGIQFFVEFRPKIKGNPRLSGSLISTVLSIQTYLNIESRVDLVFKGLSNNICFKGCNKAVIE